MPNLESPIDDSLSTELMQSMTAHQVWEGKKNIEAGMGFQVVHCLPLQSMRWALHNLPIERSRLRYVTSDG